MARKRGNLPVIDSLAITALAAEGKALGKYEEMVVFVPMAVPGDVVKVQVTARKRRFMEARILEFITRSPLRVEAFCDHFGVCGGCKWQNLPYEEQLKQKQQQVEDQLLRIGKLDIPTIRPILGSEATRYYRNKLEFTFAPRRWRTWEEVQSGVEFDDETALGFHIPGMFDKILDIDSCHLQPEPSNRLRNEIHRFCREQGYTFYDQRQHQGLMRTLIVRTASTGEVMLIVVFGEEDRERREALLSHLETEFPEITALLYVVNTKFNDTIADQQIHLWSGRDHIFEEMEGLRFKIGPKSFYQTNSAQAYELYKVARELAEIAPGDTVYDLYTGTGTIANFVARGCRKVVGVEYVAEAIEDARVNSALNGIDNTVFYAGDMKDILTADFIARNGRPEVVILDPPRAGVHEDVIRVLLECAPQRIVYVSCNPATQARDAAMLEAAYRITAVQPVDMFPQTHHVENVIQFLKK